jgi:ATP-dependent Clp protease ATP-binding subunit ClpX
MEGILLDLMYELPSMQNVEEVMINADVVDNGTAPLIVHSDSKREGGKKPQTH